jgi:hypothetical protein
MSAHISESIGRERLRIWSDAEVRRLAAEFEIDEKFNLNHYVPPGPVAQGFILDETPTSTIMGPLGAGKTTACTFKRVYFGSLAPVAWHPDDHKPTRMCRGIVLRDTFRAVEKTVLESWRQWFHKRYPGSDWSGGNDRPATHTLRFMGHDGVRVEMITEFAGLGEMNIGDLMKGREYSFSWLNEIDTHAKGALDDMEQRVGRYPSAESLLTRAEIKQLERKLGHQIISRPSRMRAVIGDMNAPTIDNWTYETLITNRAPDRAFFQQPSGRSAQAENRHALEPDYYDRIIRNQEEHFVRRMVDNKFGYSRSGKPVHPGFDHRRHVADHPIPFDNKLDLLIGLDVSTNALTPAAMFGQVHAPARVVFIDELAPGHGVGPARFAEMLMRKINEEFGGTVRLKVWADPASQFGGDKLAGQLAAMEIISVVLGVPVQIPFGGSNEISLRLGAVDAELRGYLEPNSSLLISPKCTGYIAGIAGQYRFKRLSESASNDYDDAPEKRHPVSDLQDAGQYLVGGLRGRQAVIRSAAGQVDRGRANGGWGAGKTRRASRGGGFDVHRVGG